MRRWGREGRRIVKVGRKKRGRRGGKNNEKKKKIAEGDTTLPSSTFKMLNRE